MPSLHSIEITHIYVAAGHNFVKQKEKDPERYPARDLESAAVVAGAGLAGDRYYTEDPGYDAHVTFFQQEAHDELVKKFGAASLQADRYRRNICVSGYDINLLLGKEFELGGIRFRGTRKADPCKWMDVSVHPGAWDFLKGRGGIRAQVLSSGTLRKGPAKLAIG